MSNQFINSPKLVQPKRLNKKVKIVLIILGISAILMGIFLIYILFFSNSNSASFINNDRPERIVKGVEMQTIESDNFKIDLPATWVNNGIKNPFSNEYYYELQDKKKSADARYLRIYINTFPSDYPLNRVVLVENMGNRLKAGEVSGDCKSLPDAPKNIDRAQKQTWLANWQGLTFTCDLSSQVNHLGIASQKSGYGQTLTGPISGTNKYFLVYIDNTSSPNDRTFIDAINSFEVK